MKTVWQREGKVSREEMRLRLGLGSERGREEAKGCEAAWEDGATGRSVIILKGTVGAERSG